MGQKICKECSGSGSDPDRTDLCDECGGSGRVSSGKKKKEIRDVSQD